MRTNKLQYNGGAAMMMFVIFLIFGSITVIVGIVTPVMREFQIASSSLKSKSAYFLSESGVEDALYRLKNNKQIGTSETIVLGTSSATTTITDINSNQKSIESLADANSYQRKIAMVINKGDGASFNYGIQTGTGGISMSNGSKVIGNVYSNGDITGSGSITGSATAANSSVLVADQTNGTGTPAYNVTFGNASTTEDIAQSFTVSADNPVTKVQLYIKKVSTPSNATIKIVNDNGGVPGSTILATGILSSSAVSTSYGWAEVNFSTNPILSNTTTAYWLILDASTSATKYYVLGANSNGYAGGVGKIGQSGGTWNNTTPTGLDMFFQIYTGGFTGLIDGITVGTGSIGNAYAHTINNSTIRGTNYCQTGTGNNKVCNTTLADPVQTGMPISEQNISDWKDNALAGGIYSGNYSASGSAKILGPKKIVGNLTVDNGGTLSMSGTLWVTGNLSVNNNGSMNLVSGYGSNDGVIVVDGTIDVGNNATFSGSGTAGSYILALSTSYSSSAVTLGNNAGAVVLYAANGTITASNNATAKELNGYNIVLGNNTTITYDSGLANLNFVSGPSGSYTISSWKETQ